MSLTIFYWRVTMSKLSLIATFSSVPKTNHIHSSRVQIGELFCKLQLENLFNIYGNALKDYCASSRFTDWEN